MPENNSLMVSRKIDGRLSVMLLSWSFPPGFVHIFVTFKTPVTDGQVPAVLRALNEWNKDPIGVYHLNERGKVTFAAWTMLDAAGRVDSEQLVRLLDLCEQAVARRAPELQALVAGDLA